jgi:alkylhydroperoxidase family enzyme
MSFGGPPDEVHSDKRTGVAVDFAKKCIEDHHAVSDDDFARLHALFTDEEIAALCTYIAFIGGANRLGAMFGLSQRDAG